MSKDKTEDDAKKRTREETEQIERSDARGQKPEKPGGFRDLFEGYVESPGGPPGFEKRMNGSEAVPHRGRCRTQ